MSYKRYCLVRPSWTPDDCARHTCDDRSHIHLSRSQLAALEADDLVEWLHQPVNRHDKGIVRLRRLLPARGLSCRVGAELAEAVQRGLAWARVMLADIDSPTGF
jgi:hypothetical protein